MLLPDRPRWSLSLAARQPDADRFQNFPRVRAEHDEEVNRSDANSIGKPCDQTVIPC
jgi:hypothetical protein